MSAATNLELFLAAYVQHLTAAVQAKPETYAFNLGQVPDVARRMVDGLRAGRASKDGKALAATCKELGIPHTYTAIREYLA